MKKVSFLPENEDYYLGSALVPGFPFYRVLATSKISPEGLRIRIPETIVGAESSQYLIYTDESGRLVRKTDVAYSEFEQLIISNNKKFVARHQDKSFIDRFEYEKNSDLPFIITKFPANVEYLCSKVLC